MPVAFDARSASGAQSGNMSFTHTPVGTPRGVSVKIAQAGGSGDEVIAVTYGGAPMTRSAFNPLTSGETGAVYLYFLGAGIPTGAQTVAVTVTGTGSTKRAEVWSLTGARDTEIVDVDATINSTSLVDPSVTLQLLGRASFCGIVLFSGHDAVTGITPLAGWTARQEGDFGAVVCGMYSYDTVAAVDVTAGWTQAANDAAAIAFAVSEVDRRARVSFIEAEAPEPPRRARVSFLELETPVPADPDARRAFLSVLELEVPTASRRAVVSFMEFETPAAQRRARVSFLELEVEATVRRARVSFMELESPLSPRRARVSFLEVSVPDVGAVPTGPVARPRLSMSIKL